MAVLMLGLFQSALVVQAVEVAPPLVKRGARAWNNFGSLPTSGRWLGGVNRLHVHGVSDSTNRTYMRMVKQFLKHQRRVGEPQSLGEWDRAMADELSNMCYGRRESISNGTCLYHGWCHCFPEFRGQMPEAYRALRSWERLAQQGMGGPMSYGMVLKLVCGFFETGRLYEGLWVWAQHDLYAREQDLEQVTREDIFVDPMDETKVALRFGSRARGLSVKTGSDQAAQVDDPLVARVLSRLRRRMHAGEALFPFTQTGMRKAWNEEQRRVGIHKRYPLHSLRHSKPSADAATGRRSLEEIRRRGRWNQLKSVQRYSRSHALIMDLSDLPPRVRSEVADLEAEYPCPLLLAVHRGPGRDSPLGRLLHEVLDSAPPRDAGVRGPEAK
jgi:hypothetical protein